MVPCLCAPPEPLNDRVSLLALSDKDGDFEPVDIPDGIRAIVVLNLQSYAGGRDLWKRPPTKSGYAPASCADGKNISLLPQYVKNALCLF
jgi:hypothetical protein